MSITTARVVNYSSNIDRVTESTSNRDFLNAGFTLPIRSTRSSQLPEVLDRTRSMSCARLLLEHHSIITDSPTSAQDSYTTSTRLTTRSLLEHTDLNRIPSRSIHEQLD